jgi:hypothetical protein
LQQLHLVLQAQTLQVVAGADQRTLGHVGGHHLLGAAPGQHGRQHAGAHANVKSHRVFFQGRRQWRLGHQGHIFATHRREHAVMRVDPQVFAQCGHFDAVLAPFKSTDHALQGAQRDHRRLPIGRAKGLRASLLGVGGAAQRDAVVTVQFDQHLAQHAGALGLRLAVGVKSRTGHRRGCIGFFAFGLLRFVDAPRQGLQQLAGVVKVAAPQQARALAGQAVSRIGGQGVVGQHHAGGQVLVRAPQGRAFVVFFRPGQKGGGVHVCAMPFSRCCANSAKPAPRSPVVM